MNGLYRDDGLALLSGVNGRSAGKARKNLHEIFHQLGFKITAKVENQSVNFVDITLNLKDLKYSPYRKPAMNHYTLTADQTTLHPSSSRFQTQLINEYLHSHPINPHSTAQRLSTRMQCNI